MPGQRDTPTLPMLMGLHKLSLNSIVGFRFLVACLEKMKGSE